MRTTTWLSLTLIGVLATSALALDDKDKDKKSDKPAAGEMTDAKEILKKADAATKEVKAARYVGTFKGIGANAARVPTVEGPAMIKGWDGGRPTHIKATMTVEMPGQPKEECTIGADGENFYLIDPQTKTVYADIDPAVLGRRGQLAQVMMMLEFVHPAPFSDELNGTAELQGSEKVNGEDCYKIHVKYVVEGGPEATWYFSKKDFLPRRVDRDTQGYSLEIERLEADPKLGDDAFKLKVPEGYKKTDDFAP